MLHSFFRNVDGSSGADLPASEPAGRGERRPLPIASLRARAVLVDMVRFQGGGGCVHAEALAAAASGEAAWGTLPAWTPTTPRRPPT